MPAPVVLDIETQHSFAEVQYDHKKLGVSVVGLYDYATDQYKAYVESELPQLFRVLEHASFIIGFNINHFDLPVLASYYVGTISQFATLDIMDEVEKGLGFRVALDDLVRATLSTKKSGHGLLAIEYFRNGEWEKLKSYCLDDVKVTRQLYEFGKKTNTLYLNTATGKKEITIDFSKTPKNSTAVSLSLPF